MTRRVASSAAVGRRLEVLGHVGALAELAAHAEVGGGRRRPAVQQHRHEDAAHHLGLGPEPLVLEHPLAHDGRRPDRLTELDLVLEHPLATESIHVTARRDVLERGAGPDRSEGLAGGVELTAQHRCGLHGDVGPAPALAAAHQAPAQRLDRLHDRPDGAVEHRQRGGPAELVEAEADAHPVVDRQRLVGEEDALAPGLPPRRERVEPVERVVDVPGPGRHVPGRPGPGRVTVGEARFGCRVRRRGFALRLGRRRGRRLGLGLGAGVGLRCRRPVLGAVRGGDAIGGRRGGDHRLGGGHAEARTRAGPAAPDHEHREAREQDHGCARDADDRPRHVPSVVVGSAPGGPGRGFALSSGVDPAARQEVGRHDRLAPRDVPRAHADPRRLGQRLGGGEGDQVLRRELGDDGLPDPHEGLGGSAGLDRGRPTAGRRHHVLEEGRGRGQAQRVQRDLFVDQPGPDRLRSRPASRTPPDRTGGSPSGGRPRAGRRRGRARWPQSHRVPG